MTGGSLPEESSIPEVTVPRSRCPTASALDLPEAESFSLDPFVLAHGRAFPSWSTAVRLAWSRLGLHVEFSCADADIWGSFRGRDEPLWEEEAVEIFLAPGSGTPTRYHEFEFSPFGAVFDAVVDNPRGDRSGMRVDAGWNCGGLRWEATTDPVRRRWRLRAILPWAGLVGKVEVPRVWRANFFRIERPRGGEPEFSAWSCPFSDPPDFHRPARFGVIRLVSPPEG